MKPSPRADWRPGYEADIPKQGSDTHRRGRGSRSARPRSPPTFTTRRPRRGGREPAPPAHAAALMASARGTAADDVGGVRRSRPGLEPQPHVVWQDPVPTAAAGATMSGLEYMTAVAEAKRPAAADRRPDAATARSRSRRAASSSRASPARSTTTRSGSSTAATPRPCSIPASAAPSTRRCRPGSPTHRSGLEAKYLRPITRDTGRVLCEASVIYRGRRQATAEAALTAADSGKVLASGTSTCMVLGET